MASGSGSSSRSASKPEPHEVAFSVLSSREDRARHELGGRLRALLVRDQYAPFRNHHQIKRTTDRWLVALSRARPPRQPLSRELAIPRRSPAQSSQSEAARRLPARTPTAESARSSSQNKAQIEPASCSALGPEQVQPRPSAGVCDTPAVRGGGPQHGAEARGHPPQRLIPKSPSLGARDPRSS